MKDLIKLIICILFFTSCSTKTNQNQTAVPKEPYSPKIKKSVEVLKSEQIAEPVKDYYYYVERNETDSIIDSVLLMTPTVYDVRVKKPIWSEDSSVFVYENLLSIDGGNQVEIFDTKSKKKLFKTEGILLNADRNLESIIFYSTERRKNSDEGRINVFILKTQDLKIDSFSTIKTKFDMWEPPRLIKVDWKTKEIHLKHTPIYKNGMYISDTTIIKL